VLLLFIWFLLLRLQFFFLPLFPFFFLFSFAMLVLNRLLVCLCYSYQLYIRSIQFHSVGYIMSYPNLAFLWIVIHNSQINIAPNTEQIVCFGSKNKNTKNEREREKEKVELHLQFCAAGCLLLFCWCFLVVRGCVLFHHHNGGKHRFRQGIFLQKIL